MIGWLVSTQDPFPRCQLASKADRAAARPRRLGLFNATARIWGGAEGLWWTGTRRHRETAQVCASPSAAVRDHASEG